MDLIGTFFGWLLKICCTWTGNFGTGVWLFTLFTRILLLPVAVMVQFNSIKMVKMYPEMNRFKARYYGDRDMISEAQYELYKKEKYHPILDLVPVIIQLILLMGVVEGIRKLMAQGIDMSWLGLDLSLVPVESPGTILIIPIAAALSALLMCVTQNISNVLQSEQGMANKMITLTISVGLSLYLGLFVPAGIGLYWIAGNLLSILQMYALNFFISPKKHVDYKALEESRQELKKIEEEAARSKKIRSKEDIARERSDYRRFLKEGRKQIVFYSERNGFYKYYRNIIEYINKKTDIDIHYISSDPADEVFGITRDHFHTYYIGDNRFIVLMMKIEADLMVMTTPDLQNYQLKRSLVDKNVEYVYVPHDVNSSNLTFHKNALDHFDTIFTSGPKNKAEIREREQKAGIREKNLIEWGSSVIDNMKSAYEEITAGDQTAARADGKKPMILIAPSWQNENIMDSCIEGILDSIDTELFDVTVRPHPQYVRHYEVRIDALASKYAGRGIQFQKDFSSNRTVYTADMLITDWSSIAYEYAFSTLKPVLFINTPMKIVNPDYRELDTVPIDIEARDQVGISLDPSEIDRVGESVKRLAREERFTPKEMAGLRDRYIYNVGRSGEVGGKYLIGRVIERSRS
ncbi:MAG: YidC/Oxa1 family membrane protein insertase [Lachnospiraceae bacterium]|nr:YidC/Oxa1 family membrane protein insertase [Lachnospiraceae bacterium]